MKKYKSYQFLFIVLFATSCWQPEMYKGYSESDTGLYYKLQTIGDGNKKASFGDYLQLIITYKTKTDSIFFDSYTNNISGKVVLPYNTISFVGSFEEHLKYMNEGDSVSFIVSADSLFKKFFKTELPIFFHKHDVVKMDVKLHKILSAEQYQAEIEHYNQLMDDADIEEQRKLKIFLDTLSNQYKPMNSGLYYLPVKQGTGLLAESGDVVKINYKGTFLNGKLLESTYDRKQPMEFTLGQQGQVIKGLENAIKLLNEGGQAKFIIPSQLAYGSTGSSTGIVPPYTTLIYEIELIKIVKQNN